MDAADAAGSGVRAQVLQTVLPPAVAGQNSSKRVSSKITLQAFSPEAQAPHIYIYIYICIYVCVYM